MEIQGEVETRSAMEIDEAEKRSAMEMETEMKKRGAAFKYGLVVPYLQKFAFEDEEHVPDSEFYNSDSDSDSDDDHGCFRHHFRLPNAYEVVKRFLKQVRESNGYDVDCVPPPSFFSPFVPININTVDEPFRSVMMRAIHFAIGKINVETGKTYEFVKVEKAIDTTCSLLLVTVTVKEADTDVDDSHKTIRAMVNIPYSGKEEYTLEEWMFKPLPPATEESREDVDPERKKAKIGEGTSNL